MENYTLLNNNINYDVNTISVDSINNNSTITATNKESNILYVNKKEFKKEINKYIKNSDLYLIQKKEKKMTNFNFDFGPCDNDHVRMSMYGLAVKNTNGTWVSYNIEDNNIIDVDVFNFNGAKFLYKMPVAIKDIAVGDIIVHNRVPMFVTKINNEDTSFTAIDVRAGEVKNIIPTRNMFGFNFVTKIVSLFNMTDNTPSDDKPFGNIFPWIMMEDSKEIDPMMMMFMMNQKESVNFSNPMIMYLLMKNKNDSSDAHIFND